ncbi:ABC transporter ATP-binding protein [Salinibacterium sp. G-O1]|uniref:ABC transporter ATP-binding protein n=1 Tax=Salinibacterium sp. G-O1 TaxID=3046208 RepID=UPI0024BAD3AC|nr:ABC transporter ATP-binding protein [Salinibacterium sp. G-O1]MDJ0335624.1 ABC transporter ATP-binding protein [Salinibacterium sp. G-O1]
MTVAQQVEGGIVVEHVRRSFGEVHAVRDASFTALPGTVTGLIGPNGSGKTTLMLMLASLLQPEGGSIRIAGFDPMDATAEVRSRMGWMPDVLGSWANLSVRSTLEYAARMYGMDRSTASARAEDLVQLVDLADLAASPTRVLSRGQKQKLSLARALIHDPEVLLLDEPASGLDPGARTQLRLLVRRFAAEGKTILVSSHVLTELDEMADGVVYIDGGVTASEEAVARSRASARPWRIRSSDGEALRSALMSAGIASAEITADRKDLLVPLSGEGAAATLLAHLIGSGVPISAFAPAVGDLEHTFLDLSSGDQS